MIPIKNLHESSFSKYGSIIEFDSKTMNNFQIKIIEQENIGWRIALLKVENKSFNRISCHPNTMETFEPIEGISIIVVAEHDRPQELEAFLLDKPVGINKSVWHNLITLSNTSLIKITENAQVQSEIYELGKEFKVGFNRT